MQTIGCGNKRPANKANKANQTNKKGEKKGNLHKERINVK
jgi:hypothetical protein